MFVEKRRKSIQKKICSDLYRIRWGCLAVCIYGILAQSIFGTVCPFKIMTGLDCPGCGLTRGSLCVLTGQWSRAVSYNVMSFAWVILILFLLVQRYLMNKKKIFWELPVAVVSAATVFVWIRRIVLSITATNNMMYYKFF